jgi:hypothetical protein
VQAAITDDAAGGCFDDGQLEPSPREVRFRRGL